MTKETKYNVKQYAASSLMLLGGSLMFSLLSLIFVVDSIPKWISFIVSFLFMAPVFILAYSQGTQQAEKLFKKKAQTRLNDIHSETVLNIPVYECVFHLIGFLVPIILLDIFAVIFKNNVVQLIGVMFEFPIVLLFMTVGVLDLRVPKAVNLAILIPYVLLIAGAFVVGFIIKITRLKRQYADINNELRAFDN